MLWLRQPVFLGSRIRLRGRRSLRLERGVAIGDECVIDARGAVGVALGRGSRLGRRGIVTTTSHLSVYGVGLVMGENSGVGDQFHIGASGGVTIGDNVIVGPYLLVHSQEHRFADRDRPVREQGTVERAVSIGDDCWIGSRVTLLAGAKLGPRTVVASGAVVRGEFPGSQVLAGVPARSVREI